MKKKYRKVRPQVPHYSFLKGEDCWDCKNRNGCSGCRRATNIVATQKKKQTKLDFFREIKHFESI